MGTLRQKLESDMKIARFRPRTQETYLRHVEQFLAYHGKEAEQLGRDEVREWLVHLIEDRGLSASTLRTARAALLFLYRVTLNRPLELESLPVPRQERRVPVVLSGQEVEALLQGMYRLKYRAITMAMYGAGLRVTEACQLRVEHIDSQRMVLQFPGKGGKQRRTLLSPRLLENLREYWRAERPTGEWLFPGQGGDEPVSRQSVHRVLKKVAERVGLSKPANPHVLRHSFATHLLELGTPLPVLKELMGHSWLRTTETYLHVSREQLARTTSPLDVLGTPAAVILG